MTVNPGVLVFLGFCFMFIGYLIGWYERGDVEGKKREPKPPEPLSRWASTPPPPPPNRLPEMTRPAPPMPKVKRHKSRRPNTNPKPTYARPPAPPNPPRHNPIPKPAGVSK